MWTDAQRRRLVRLCASLSGDRDAAEDLAQETLLEAWRNAGKLTDPAGVDRWLAAVARNVCKRWARGRAREPFALPEEPTGPDLLAELERSRGLAASEIAARLEALASRAPAFDLCLYNAGMDPHEDCPIGGLRGITRAILAERERLVFDWCRRLRLPVAFVLAGGYTGPALDEHGLVELHRLTLAAAAG
jgi:hypothetical protein